MNNQSLETITLAQFESTGAQSSRERRTVVLNSRDMFKVNAVLVTLINATLDTRIADIRKKVSERTDRFNRPTVTIEEYLLSLNFKGLSSEDFKDSDHILMDMSRAEVELIKILVTDEMSEQEKKRDADNKAQEEADRFTPDNSNPEGPTILGKIVIPTFDADMYIQFKYLLLDIREWLCGSIVD